LVFELKCGLQAEISPSTTIVSECISFNVIFVFHYFFRRRWQRMRNFSLEFLKHSWSFQQILVNTVKMDHKHLIYQWSLQKIVNENFVFWNLNIVKDRILCHFCFRQKKTVPSLHNSSGAKRSQALISSIILLKQAIEVLPALTEVTGKFQNCSNQAMRLKHSTGISGSEARKMCASVWY
jgi:hypothetical protein